MNGSNTTILEIFRAIYVVLHLITRSSSGCESRELNTQYYLEEALQEYIMSFPGLISKNFIFMENHTKPYTAAVVRWYLEEMNALIRP